MLVVNVLHSKDLKKSDAVENNFRVTIFVNNGTKNILYGVKNG